jgi:outer membrane murein-binding lipoprotein Lpp
MDAKTIIIALSAAVLSALGAGVITQKDFDEMAAEVDRVRAAQAQAASEVGQYRETVPAELAKALQETGLSSKRLLAMGACKYLGHGQVACQLEEGREVQFNATQSAKIGAEVDAMAAEDAAKIEAVRLAKEEADKLAAESKVDPSPAPAEEIKEP